MLDTRSGGVVGASGVVSVNLASRLPESATAVVFNLTADRAGCFWVPEEPCTAGCVYAWGQNYGRLGDCLTPGTWGWGATSPTGTKVRAGLRVQR